MQTSSPFLWKWKLGWSYPLIFNYIGLSQILIHISNPNFSFYKTSSLEVSCCPCPHPPPSLPIKSINSDSQCPVAPSYQLVLAPMVWEKCLFYACKERWIIFTLMASYQTYFISIFLWCPAQIFFLNFDSVIKYMVLRYSIYLPIIIIIIITMIIIIILDFILRFTSSSAHIIIIIIIFSMEFILCFSYISWLLFIHTLAVCFFICSFGCSTFFRYS